MFALMFAAIGGGIATVSVMAPTGLIPAFLSAPIGGSLCALLAAIHISRRPSEDGISQDELDAQTDEMVAALRSMAAQGKDAAIRPERESAASKAA
ncbi:hypothetical protein G3T14_09480 [Methylobacterium sp. BTF04]|uniref:hypothetical protein n=1 Tax=Methylobacterium sp. BTF04 TaxID=2708300 RepID=UPI0013D00058|nr:hypothetical protein [Methylobacterium sp. BTF04]NEU12365.1 hypothetical protein [Methylobacterium sp. BTF04]